MWNTIVDMSSHESPAESDGRAYGGRPAAERTAERRLRFIEAGIELFGTVGYHRTTVRMLTAAAGLTNRYFYESFESTEDLLMACYAHLMQGYKERLQQELLGAGETLESRARAGLTCFYEAMRDPRFARVTHSEVLGVSSRVDALYTRSTAEFAALLMDHFAQAGVPLASRDPQEVRLVGTLLAGAVIHNGIAWVRSRYEPPLDLVVQASLKVLLGTALQLQLQLQPPPSGPGKAGR